MLDAQSTRRPTAVVCCAVADHPTALVLDAGWEVHQLLTNAAFEVHSSGQQDQLLPLDPTKASLHITLRELSMAGTLPTVGYFSGHGSPTGLSRTADGRTPFFEMTEGGLFQRAILVFSACSLGGTFPEALCSNPAHVRSVIGYQKLLVPSAEATGRWWGTAGFRLFREAFLAALVQPMVTLLQGGTVEDAKKSTMRKWGEQTQNPNIDPRLKYFFWANAFHQLTIWGITTATL